MGLAVLPLSSIGALSPFITEDLGISKSGLGLLITAGFAVASLGSLAGGHLADATGGRPTLVGLLLLVAASLALASLAPGYAWLAVAVTLAGSPQALSNPATNKVITASVAAPRRATVVGVKQSGVQLGTLAAGLFLPSLATVLDWRGALRVAAVLPLLAALAALRLPPAERPAPALRSGWRWQAPSGLVRWLAAYSLLVGGGTSGTTTYLALYAHERFGFSEVAAGALLGALGASAIAARILWAQRSARTGGTPRILSLLALGAAGSALLLWGAERASGWLLWPGAVGVGTSALAANAVTQLAVITGSRPDQAGQASALVAAGFFAGFVITPAAFGTLADATGSYGPGWLLVAAEFAAAWLVAAGWQRWRARPRPQPTAPPPQARS